MQSVRNHSKANNTRRSSRDIRIEDNGRGQESKFTGILKSLNWMRVILIVTAFYAVLSIFLRFMTISSQKSKQQALLNEKAKVEAELQELEDQKEYVGSNEYVERVAREKLGWAKDNEIVFKKKDN